MNPKQVRFGTPNVSITDRLTAIPTRLLLKWLDLARKCNGSYSPTGCSSSEFQITVEDLKVELATREHIPNKREAKAIRQARARR